MKDNWKQIMISNCTIRTLLELRKRAGVKLFFHATTGHLDAFHYMKNFNHLMPKDLMTLVEKHQEFATSINTMVMKFMSEAQDLTAIREVYKSSHLSEAIEVVVKEHVVSSGEDRDKLTNLARIIRKWSARDRMTALGFYENLERIHDDNCKKYGNAIGPTLSYLEKKYQGDERAIAKAAERFRSDEDIKRDFSY